MGARGPLPDPKSRRSQTKARKSAKIPPRRRATSRDLAVVPTSHPEAIPAPPADLKDAGRAAWIEAWSVPWAYESDGRAIARLARLEDERAILLEGLRAVGSLLEKPIVTPKGEVVGTEYYTNPAHRELRRLDTAIKELQAPLGLTPMARSRLGQAVVALEEGAERLEQQRIKDRYRQIAATAQREDPEAA